MADTCCGSHHHEGCCDGGPGCCPDCPINPWRDENGEPARVYSRVVARRAGSGRVFLSSEAFLASLDDDDRPEQADGSLSSDS